ncbi:MAG: PBSX family phage terminase large subunit [Elusimicrobiota bacterium]
MVLEKNIKAYNNPKTRIIVNEGGTGSSKTYSIAQLMVSLLHREPTPTRITISRKSLPTLRRTAMRDFFNIMKGIGLYDENKHNKTDKTYQHEHNMVEFIAADSARKLRSQRRDILWINESNEFDQETFRQFAMRTEKKIFMDYNPSDEFHWIYDDVIPREDCKLIKSTFLDNPFLEKSVVNEIKRYKDVDENYWKIYGLGERGMSKAKIFNNWRLINELPNRGEILYGLDFGWNNASALVKVEIYDDDLYLDEIIYETRLTTEDLIDKMNKLKVSKDYPIYPDPSEPEKIYKLTKAGFYIPTNEKGKAKTDNDVGDGIDYMKSRRIFVTSRSANLLKELKSYSWKTKGEKLLDEPVKVNDHAIDASRYGAFSHSKKAYIGFV